jgi:hypothetical protein
MAMLVNLKALVVSNNQLEGFDGIGIWKQLPDLRELVLSHNNITGFVGEWGDCKNLVTLDLCKYLRCDLAQNKSSMLVGSPPPHNENAPYSSFSLCVLSFFNVTSP